MRKFLFVGLGGSGGKTLRFLRNDLVNWLNEHGISEFPEGWQLLHIDTPAKQDGAEIREVPMLPPSAYVGLVSQGVDFDAVATKLDTAGSGSTRDLATWRVDPTFLNVPISVGAGQFRAVGRSIGLAYAGAIARAIGVAADRLSTASAGAELTRVHQAAFGTADPTPQDPIVVVISSLAGGTGAGLVIDTCDILRQKGSWGGQSFGLLYASDVFSEIGGFGAGGVQPNSLAALSELMNAYWINSNWPRSNTFFDVGHAPLPVDRSGPAFPFLIGASNTRGITFGNQKAIYSMMGRALKSWTIDPAIQDRLVAYTIANWENSAQANIVRVETLVQNHNPVFDAFGYAEVGLGTDRLERYSAQRIAKQAAVWLYEGHLIRARQIAPDDVRTPSEIETAMAEEYLLTVLHDLQLSERGAKQNEIIDALRPPEAEAEFHGHVNTIHQLATDGASGQTADAWTSRLAELISTVAPEYERSFDIGVRTRAADWVESKPEEVLRSAIDLARRFGLRVAAKTLELLAEELRQVAVELSGEAVEADRYAKDARSAIRAELPQSGKYQPANPQLLQAAETGFATEAGWSAEAILKRVASQLMTDFADGFVEPLATSIRYSYERLRISGFDGDGDALPAVPQWPDEAVPDDVRPPANEFLVIPVEQFASTFVTQLERSTKSQMKAEKELEARSDVIDGVYLDEEKANDGVPRPIVQTRLWAPTRGLTLGSTNDRTTATFDVNFEPHDLLQRSALWLRRPGTSFERLLASDLRSYLDDDPNINPQEMADRRSRFLAALSSALDAAEPLVRINQGLRTLMHGGSEGRRAVPSTLPFAGHPIEQNVRDVLHSALGLQEGDQAARNLSSATSVRSIAISATLGAPHDPMVFDSITAPIIAGWAAAGQSPAAMVAFWRNRRARPIREFVPVSQEILMALTRGWFTGTLLGLIDWEKGMIAATPAPVRLPSRLLTQPANPRDRLPALLETIGLAFCEVAREGSLRPLAPYVALRDMGVAPNTLNFTLANLYSQPNVAIVEWVKSGTAPGAITKGVADRALAMRADSDLVPADRVDVLLERLNDTEVKYRHEYEQYLETARHHSDHLGVGYGLWFSMADTIFGAFQDLKQAISKIVVEDDLEM